MSRAVAAGMIVLYQRHLSPRKGFGCPMRVVRGRYSCAEFARRAVGRVGVLRLLPLMRRRFARCAAARCAALTPQPEGEGAGGVPQPLDYPSRRPPPERGEKRRRWGRRSSEGSPRTACDWCNACDAGDVLCCPLDFIDCNPTG